MAGELEVGTIDWEKNQGLVPAVVQDHESGRVLMLGFMNREALRLTLEQKRVTFWSRSRRKLWTKGETSGHYLELKSIRSDCDQDTLLVHAEPRGPACHRGTISCFAEDHEFSALEFFGYLSRLVQERRQQQPAGSYTSALFQSGLEEIAKKVGEEAVEVVLSAAQSRKRSVEETADLLYHLLVFLAEREISLARVMEELQKRHFK